MVIVRDERGRIRFLRVVEWNGKNGSGKGIKWEEVEWKGVMEWRPWSGGEE